MTPVTPCAVYQVANELVTFALLAPVMTRFGEPMSWATVNVDVGVVDAPEVQT